MNILFVCSQNRWRSRTAETIFKDNQHQNDFRSAGTATDARIKVNEKLINWADLIFVTEKRHKQLLQEKFNEALIGKEIIVLHIEDNYHYMKQGQLPLRCGIFTSSAHVGS